MCNRILLAVFAILVGVQSTNAGVIVHQQFEFVSVRDAGKVDGLVDLMASSERQPSVPMLVDGKSSSMADSVFGGSSTSFVFPLPCMAEVFTPLLAPLWRISIANAMLPCSPFNDGLLKPS